LINRHFYSIPDSGKLKILKAYWGNMMGTVISIKQRARLSEIPVGEIAQRGVAAFYADEFGHYKFVNATWSKVTKVAQEDVAGDLWLSAVHKDDRKEVQKLWDDAVAGELFFSAEYRLNGHSHTHVLCQAIPQYSESGEYSGHSGTLLELPVFHRQALSEDRTG
jgi:PAS domain-containing protein